MVMFSRRGAVVTVCAVTRPPPASLMQKLLSRSAGRLPSRFITSETVAVATQRTIKKTVSRNTVAPTTTSESETMTETETRRGSRPASPNGTLRPVPKNRQANSTAARSLRQKPRNRPETATLWSSLLLQWKMMQRETQRTEANHSCEDHRGESLSLSLSL
jgi:hypothetical protein